MWYVLDRVDDIISVHENEPTALTAAHSIVDRMVENGEMRACVFVVTKAHFDTAVAQGESPRRWRSYQTGGARLVRPSTISVCR